MDFVDKVQPLSGKGNCQARMRQRGHIPKTHLKMSPIFSWRPYLTNKVESDGGRHKH